MKTDITILYLDDEVQNLNAFKASFRKQYSVFTAINVTEAYSILKQEEIQVVISDQRMPEVTGVEFFESIKHQYPNTIRIITTAYADINVVIDAINKGSVYRYLAKPWDERELKVAVENANRIYELQEKNKELELKYQRVFLSTTDPILLFNKDLNVTDANAAGLDFFNLDKYGSLPTNLSALIASNIDIKEITTGIRLEKSILDYECNLNSKMGVKNCILSITEITDNSGNTKGYQAIFKDISKKTEINQLLIKKVIETQEDERERIAKDLHDSIGQSLTAISLYFQILKNKYLRSKPIHKELEKIPELITDATIEFRQILYNTLPAALEEENLVGAIDELKTKLATDDFSIIFKYDRALPSVTKLMSISIYRIIQEFINNSIKHSGANELRIDLLKKNNQLLLNLRDNGSGFNINELKIRGRGLKNIRNRVSSFKGQFAVNSSIKKGTSFEISFPIEQSIN